MRARVLVVFLLSRLSKADIVFQTGQGTLAATSTLFQSSGTDPGTSAVGLQSVGVALHFKTTDGRRSLPKKGHPFEDRFVERLSKADVR